MKSLPQYEVFASMTKPTDRSTTFSKSAYEGKERTQKEGERWKYPLFLNSMCYVAIQIQHGCIIVDSLFWADAAMSGINK